MRLALAAALLLPAAARAELACPPVLEQVPQAQVLAPQGWRVDQPPQRHALRFAEFYVGDPANRVQLRGEDKDYPRLVWWPTPPEREGYTLICRYEGTEVGLVARVPEGTQRCEVRQLRADGRLVRGGQPVTGATRMMATCR